MSDAASNLKDTNMTEDDVIAFLKDNPEFLKNNLEELIPARKRPKKGAVADFQSYVIERLKSDKEEVIGISKDIVETSRANMNNQKRVHDAVLRLLESTRFDDFIHTITMDLASVLNVDIAVFLVEANGNDIPHISTSGVRVIPSGTVDKWMDGKNVLLQDNISGIEPIYGGGAALVKSQILLRVDISMDTPPAILAFGSRDPNMFAPGQATDQINFLARVIERCFRNWLSLPI
ncbi:MAG TPA: DUF484 domain-containing protein [Rhodospirillaceae bacterium]|nr:DUF484 domain-containing protein [Rhodospirillaceae bacterium]